MKLRINITKKSVFYTIFFICFSILSKVLFGISLFNMFMFIGLYLLAVNIEVVWSEKWSWLWTIFAIGAGSILTTWLVQYVLLAEDLREKISYQKFFLNICCCLVVYLLVQICTNHVGRTCIIVHSLLVVFAAANHYVYEFRGNELTFGDLKSVFTGLSVASNYQFTLNAQILNTILLSMILVTIAQKLQIRCKRRWCVCVICLLLAICASLYVAKETRQTVTETWEQKGSYRNGYLLNFALSIRDSFVEKPKLYSMEVIENLEQAYVGQTEVAKGEKPTIIAIMNESFADLRVLGNLETNAAVMPFIDSLTENTIKGFALASVYGAKTPNSEWEFLTGNSMAYLPNGSVAYQQYVKDKNAYSLVDTLKKEEYTCVAMHPYYATGWSRDTIYPKFGFDEMYFLEEFDQSNLMREYVSDAAMYDKLIERYEQGKGKENLFLMGVTMQNHGGYKDSYENFPVDIYGSRIRFPDVDQYLSLARQTDLAVQRLIEYFAKEEEPVVLCFFGDHQPSLNTTFYRYLNGKGTANLTLDELQEFYEVPFFIWSNYESENKTVERTSLNFLSSMLLEQAGIQLPPYQLFLQEFRDVVPAMNARGYYSKKKRKYVHYGEGAMEEEIWVERYRVLQYNGLFDNRNRSEIFFSRQNKNESSQ